MQRVEAAYNRLDLIAQIFVYGNSLENVLVAVVVPEEAGFVSAANKQGLSGSYKELVKNEAAKAFLLKRMDATAKEAKLKVTPNFFAQLIVHTRPVPMLLH